MLVNERIEFIVDWIKGYSDKVKYNPVSLIIGVSGGVDSAVASTLSAKTKLKTFASYSLVKTMRASILVLGPLISKFHKSTASYPCLLYTSPSPRD